MTVTEVNGSSVIPLILVHAVEGVKTVKGRIPAELAAAGRLVKCWSNAAKRWSNAGQMLVKCWSNAGQTLVKRNENAGQTLVRRCLLIIFAYIGLKLDLSLRLKAGLLQMCCFFSKSVCSR